MDYDDVVNETIITPDGCHEYWVQVVPGGGSDMVTAVVTATPDVFGGKMLRFLGRASVVRARDWGHWWPGSGLTPGPQWPVSVSGHNPEHAHRVLPVTRPVHVTRRARAVTAWRLTWAAVSCRSARHRSVTLAAWHHMTSWHWSLLLFCHSLLSRLSHSCCQGSLPISELVLS